METSLNSATKFVIPGDDKLDLRGKVIVRKMPLQSRDEQEIKSVFSFSQYQLLGDLGLFAVHKSRDRTGRDINLALSGSEKRVMQIIEDRLLNPRQGAVWDPKKPIFVHIRGFTKCHAGIKVLQGDPRVTDSCSYRSKLKVSKLEGKTDVLKRGEKFGRKSIPWASGEELMRLANTQKQLLGRLIKSSQIYKFTMDKAVVQRDGSSKASTKGAKESNRVKVSFPGSSPVVEVRLRSKVDTKILDKEVKTGVRQGGIKDEKSITNVGPLLVSNAQDLGRINIETQGRKPGDNIKNTLQDVPTLTTSEEVIARSPHMPNKLIS